MSARQIIRNVALALAGLVAAVAIGLTANTISGDSVGLSAQPLSAGEALAPEAASQDDRAAARSGAQASSGAEGAPRTAARAGANDHHAGRAPADGHDRRRRAAATTTRADRATTTSGGRGGSDDDSSGSGSGDDDGGDDNSGHGGGDDD